MISGFRREVDEIGALLVYYAAYGGNSLLTFRDKLSVPYSGVKKSFEITWRWTDRISRNISKKLPPYLV